MGWEIETLDFGFRVGTSFRSHSESLFAFDLRARLVLDMGLGPGLVKKLQFINSEYQGAGAGVKHYERKQWNHLRHCCVRE